MYTDVSLGRYKHSSNASPHEFALSKLGKDAIKPISCKYKGVLYVWMYVYVCMSMCGVCVHMYVMYVHVYVCVHMCVCVHVCLCGIYT